MPGSEVVPQAAGMATLPMSNPPKTFLLPFGKNQHLVPESAFVSFPKKPNKMQSAEALGALLATKAPEKWLPYCTPNTLCRIAGETGNCVYTTFQVDGHPGEERILRFISAAIAEKNFEKIKETTKLPEATNDRHGEKSSQHHHVAHRVRGPSGWLPLASDDVTGEPIEYIQATRGQGRCL